MRTLTRKQRDRLLTRRLRRLRQDVADQVRSLQKGTLKNPYPDGYPDELLKRGCLSASTLVRPAWFMD